MEDVLKIKKGQWKSSKSCLFQLFSIWLMLLVCLNFPLVYQFFIFMFFFLPLVGLFFYTSYVLGLHPFALFNESLIYH